MLKNFTEFNNKTEKRNSVIKNTTKMKSIKSVNENVTKINDQFKVKTVYSVPVSLIKEYINKVKTEEGKNPLEFWSAADLAEEIVKYTLEQYLKLDNIPAKMILGDVKTRDELEANVEDTEESDDIEVTEKESDGQDFTKDETEEIEVEEEESYGMTDQFTDRDLKYIA